MRKRTALVLTAGVLVMLAVGSVGFSSAASDSPVGPWGRTPGRSYPAPTDSLESHEGGQTLVFTGRTVNFAFINTDGRGLTPGDYIVFRDRLFNRAGEHVGVLRVQCFVNFPHGRNQAFLCDTAANIFHRGQILSRGGFLATPTSTGLTLGVTGGTGHWQNARGEAHARFVDEVTTRYTVHIIP